MRSFLNVRSVDVKVLGPLSCRWFARGRPALSSLYIVSIEPTLSAAIARVAAERSGPGPVSVPWENGDEALTKSLPSSATAVSRHGSVIVITDVNGLPDEHENVRTAEVLNVAVSNAVSKGWGRTSTR